MAVSLQIFLLEVVQVEVVLRTKVLPVLTFTSQYAPQMEAFYVSLVLFVSRAWDAVTDPLIGYLVGRSRWTSVGKLSPWLVGWWRRLEQKQKSRLSRPSAQQTFVPQAGSVHSVCRPLLSAAVVRPSGGGGGGRRAVVPPDHLSV